MADRQLQNVLNSGELTSAYFGGTTGNDKVIIKSDLSTIEQDVSDVRTPQHGVINPNVPIVSLNTDTTQFDVVAFDYYIHGSKYSFPGGTYPGGFGQAGDFIDIGVDVNSTGGNLVFKINGFFTPSELLSVLEIGRIATDNGSTITSIGDSVFFQDETVQNLYVRFKSFEGSKFFNGTCKPTENQSVPFTFDIEGGVISTANMQKQDVSAEVQVDGFPIYSIGGTVAIRPQQIPLIAQNTQYDNGTDLAPIPTGNYVVHTLFRSSGTTQYYLQYGKETFDRLNDAVLSTPVDDLFSMAGSEVEKIGKVIVQEGASEITVIYDIREGRNTPLSPVPQQADKVELLAASTATTQQPSGTDNPIQIEFGPAQVNDNVDLAADGTITFKKSQNYQLDLLLQFGRTGGAGEAELFGRSLVNDVQTAASIYTKLDDEDTVIPFSRTLKRFFNAGDTYKIEIVRDSAGNNAGGLFQQVSSIGWNDAPTAQILITSYDY